MRQYGDPVLRMRANEVEAFDEELVQLCGADDRRSCTTPTASGSRRRRSGSSARLFVFNDEGEDRVVVNPVLTVTGAETEVDEEGCLSLGPVRMPVERALEVTLDGVRRARERRCTSSWKGFPPASCSTSSTTSTAR